MTNAWMSELANEGSIGAHKTNDELAQVQSTTHRRHGPNHVSWQSLHLLLDFNPNRGVLHLITQFNALPLLLELPGTPAVVYFPAARARRLRSPALSQGKIPRSTA
jgi:hypothetical protein